MLRRSWCWELLRGTAEKGKPAGTRTPHARAQCAARPSERQMQPLLTSEPRARKYIAACFTPYGPYFRCCPYTSLPSAGAAGRHEPAKCSAARAALVVRAERFSAIFWASSATTLKTDLLGPEILSPRASRRITRSTRYAAARRKGRSPHAVQLSEERCALSRRQGEVCVLPSGGRRGRTALPTCSRLQNSNPSVILGG